MDVAVFAIAFNLFKLHRKQKKAVFAQKTTVKNKKVDFFRVYQHHEEKLKSTKESSIKDKRECPCEAPSL